MVGGAIDGSEKSSFGRGNALPGLRAEGQVRRTWALGLLGSQEVASDLGQLNLGEFLGRNQF